MTSHGVTPRERVGLEARHLRAEQLAADRRSMGLTDIGLARTAVISAMSALDMPQTRGAHVLLGEIADLLQTAKSEASR